MADAFGLVALVAMTPLIAIQILGLVYKSKYDKMTADTEESAEQAETEIIDLGTEVDEDIIDL